MSSKANNFVAGDHYSKTEKYPTKQRVNSDRQQLEKVEGLPSVESARQG